MTRQRLLPVRLPVVGVGVQLCRLMLDFFLVSLLCPTSSTKAFVLWPLPYTSRSTCCPQHENENKHKAFLHSNRPRWCRRGLATFFLNVYAPPGSGYLSQDDEVSELPGTYEPMMEYPGTMRPGRTPENIPYQDLPIGDDDPDPVPWPHFQQIEWHHRWDPPHEHPTPMEEFIDQQGRWATPELEAEMRAGVRRGIREKKEAEEAERRGTIITDDDEEDDDMVIDADASVALGDGIFGQLGSTADQAATAAAVDPNNQNQQKGAITDDEDDEEDDGGDSSLENFLFDLGLDSDLGEDEEEKGTSSSVDDAVASPGPQSVTKSLRDLERSDDDDDDIEDNTSVSTSRTINVDEDDDDLDFDDDDDMVSGDSTGGGPVPLDDFGGGNDDDSLAEDIFDEGGFDFGDDFDDGGGDMW